MSSGKSELFFPPAELVLQPAERHTVRETGLSCVPKDIQTKRIKALYEESRAVTRRRWPTHNGVFDLHVSGSALPRPFPKKVRLRIFAGECDVDNANLVEFLSRFQQTKNYYRYTSDSDALGGVYIPMAAFGKRRPPARCTLALSWEEVE